MTPEQRLAELRLDEDARALGLRSEHIAAVRGHRFEATGTTLRGSNRLDRDQQIRFRPLP